MKYFSLLLFMFGLTLSCSLSAAELSKGVGSESADERVRRIKLEDLGRSLFFDINLSKARTQSCATCHDPVQGFVDWRDNSVASAASMGGDMISIGDRNAPTISYARYSPEFHQDSNGQFFGGQFLDGRELNLEGQAGGPPLNPLEMAMPDKASVVARLQESPVYRVVFKNLFGDEVFNDIENTYLAMTQGLAAFERSEFFSPFDSKYDRFLQGSYDPTEEEELGITLFFSEQFSNCNQCHQLSNLPISDSETFSNYGYFNIGVPVNKSLRAINGLGSEYIDHGLLDNPSIHNLKEDGKFKVPTLRNVAITGPYMHNGIFSDLTTVMKFYNKYNAKGSKAEVNPETGEHWGDAEVSENIALEELEFGPALDSRRIAALIAFMEMLTDKRYEPLLEF